jgi:hypothetical protein
VDLLSIAVSFVYEVVEQQNTSLLYWSVREALAIEQSNCEHWRSSCFCSEFSVYLPSIAVSIAYGIVEWGTPLYC